MPLQAGIYYDVGQRPGGNWGALFLRVQAGATAFQIDRALVGLWKIYDGLRAGQVNDLPGVAIPAGNLTVLIGYGPKAFAVPNARRPLPDGLSPRFQFASPAASGGGTPLPGSGLRYATGVVRNPATEEIMVQAIADTPLAVARVFVETQKFLDDHLDPDLKLPVLQLAAGYTGFNRDDGRSWIDFHDGVSNLTSGAERYSAIAIDPETPAPDDWTGGGTYLAHFKLAVDLQLWRSLTPDAQELTVGRAKLTGCPLTSLASPTKGQADGACPFIGTSSILADGNDAFREPPQVADPTLLASHVQRANHHIGPINRDVSKRIFRQGYEFIAPPEPGKPLVQGLNFVSFQESLTRVFTMLTTATWLGGTNFGGAIVNPANPLLTVLSAGVFLCPPTINGEAYPGRSIFMPA